MPIALRANPQTAMPMMPIMKAYTGTAKALPDSRVPRRLIVVSTTTRTTATGISCPRTIGRAAPAFCTPELIDTATVRT